MTLIPYTFQVLDSNQNAVLGLTFTTTGLASGGAPGVAILQKDPAVLGGTPTAIVPIDAIISFFERGQGLYAVLFDPDVQEGDCFLVVDAGSSLNGINRYIPVPLPRDSSRILAGITETGGVMLDATGFDNVAAAPAPTAGDTTYRTTLMGQLGAVIARRLNKSVLDRTARTITVYADDSTDTSMVIDVADTGVVQTQNQAR